MFIIYFKPFIDVILKNHFLYFIMEPHFYKEFHSFFIKIGIDSNNLG
ncbi:conserved hypothetical protein [Listeria innocua FSL J1-023]|nr:conserved hypothetical protein [Listeria innocua FSL S4-378]EFR93930.1 conserved hypothetical protein [Listeria innocua FSL J1-023]